MQKKPALNENDILIRKAVVICGGNLYKTAALTGLKYFYIVDRLRTLKNKTWWQRQKKKFKKLHANARSLRGYHVQRNAAIERERLLLLREASQNHDTLD